MISVSSRRVLMVIAIIFFVFSALIRFGLVTIDTADNGWASAGLAFMALALIP